MLVPNLFRNRNRPDHVRVKPTVVLDRPGRFKRNAVFAFGFYHHIPCPISGGRGVGHDIVVRPFDRIADMGGNLCRRIGDLRHLDLDYGGVRAAQRKQQQGGYAHCKQNPAHWRWLFQFGGYVLSVLLMTLEDFQSGSEQVFKFRVTGRRN
jgi:hypothetical protein